MLDFDLQVRFWRGVSDAMLHGTEASLAAASAFQDQMLKYSDAGDSARSSRARVTQTAPETPLALWWLGPWQAMITAAGSSASPLCAPYSGTQAAARPAAAFDWMAAWSSMPCIPLMWRQPATAGSPNPFMQPFDIWAVWGSRPAKTFAGPFAAYWPWSALRWDHWQSPFTALFMSAGLPFAVASPSAKASTAALDAAHAAREQLDKMYSTYRSDGGHAASQIAALPWTIAASLLEGSGQRPGRERVVGRA